MLSLVKLFAFEIAQDFVGASEVWLEIGDEEGRVRVGNQLTHRDAALYLLEPELRIRYLAFEDFAPICRVHRQGLNFVIVDFAVPFPYPGSFSLQVVLDVDCRFRLVNLDIRTPHLAYCIEGGVVFLFNSASLARGFFLLLGLLLDCVQPEVGQCGVFFVDHRNKARLAEYSILVDLRAQLYFQLLLNLLVAALHHEHAAVGLLLEAGFGVRQVALD